MSTALDEDAGQSYHHFRQAARTLGSISSAFNTVTRSVTAAYFTALAQPAPEAWTTLVSGTASLVQMAHTLDGIVLFDAAEREALDFFEAIVHENADLLGLHPLLEAESEYATLLYV